MLDRMFMVVPTGAALVAVLAACLVRRVGVRRTCLYLALTAYVGAVAAVTLFPLPLDPAIAAGREGGVAWGITLNLVPFAGIARTVQDAAQTGWWWDIAAAIVGGNVLMFVPLGVMLPLLSERFRRLRTAALAFVASSAAIELAQLAVGLGVAGYLYRVVDVDDVILNVTGGLLGFGLWSLWSRVRDAQRKERESDNG